MSHLRTKRKPNIQNLSKLFFMVLMVFVVMAILLSLGNNLKNPLLASKSKSGYLKKEDTQEIWTLETDKTLFTKDGHVIFVKTADTTESREQGLSGTSQLKSYTTDGIVTTEGMLFVFDEEGTMRFWMKDMNYDLDMIWLNKDMEIVYIKNALASSYMPENPNMSEVFTNGDKLAKYVLEIDMGLVQKMNLKVGDVLRVQ